MLIGIDADQDVSHVAAQAVDKGVRIFCRYEKNLTAHEVMAIFAAGRAANCKVGILLIFETQAKRALTGSIGGHADGVVAARMAVALGAPKGTAIAATVDFDASAEEQAAVLSYLSGFKQGIAGAVFGKADFKLGVYANGAICQVALDTGVADFAWVAGGSGMRGTKDFIASGKAHIIQEVGDHRGLNLGIKIDSNYTLIANDPEDLGCWIDSGAQPVTEILPIPDVGSAQILPDLKDAQAGLQAAGLYSGAIDGLWGPITAAAFAAYYARNPS